MARFASAVLLAAALLMAGRLTRAEPPSTAEVLLRAVLPGAAVPDAVLQLLRPGSHLVTEDTGRSDAPLDSQNHKLERSSARVDPFSKYGFKNYEAPSGGGDDPFGKYSFDGYDATSERSTATAKPGGGDDPFGKYSFDGYDATTEHSTKPGGGGVPAAGGGGGGGDDPFGGYSFKGYDDTSERSHRAGTPTATPAVFFHEEAVRVGERLPLHLRAATPPALGLLPRRVADSIPFTTAALPAVLALLGVPPGSSRAAAMAETLRTCERPPPAGVTEAMFCATSLQALVERTMAALGTRDVRAVTSAVPRAGMPPQAYAVRAVRRVGGGGGFVACHDEAYPYTVYFCHGTGPARAYLVDMEGARGGGGAVTVAFVCHTDTSRWNPEHVSFKVLGTKPGGKPVCHLMPYGHIIWVKNDKPSPA